MDAFERAKRRYYNHTPMPQAQEYVKQLEARVAELEAERDGLLDELVELRLFVEKQDIATDKMLKLLEGLGDQLGLDVEQWKRGLAGGRTSGSTEVSFADPKP